MNDIAELNLKHYQASSDLSNQLENQRGAISGDLRDAAKCWEESRLALRRQ